MQRTRDRETKLRNTQTGEWALNKKENAQRAMGGREKEPNEGWFEDEVEGEDGREKN